ncbi:TRAP transporter large permease [Pseudoroseicyclus tamaricis]|uniref:TRAP transporter large permease protein n=1 Tax=Pseudoroseicyclus tamaricis TaxID=2705421 RepID=A0A6B2JWX1_9RHOB|nr:TRAP transporter large permease [Pseudoroseicyclus tamaricis]NDV00724.1 TRAP transporter large permease [Pseudoroseicyclus tamaricis]
MSDLALGYLSLPLLLGLIFLRLPIGLAMAACGFFGLWVATGSPDIALARLKSETYSTFSNYNLTVVPMFLLMGQLAALSGLSRSLFDGAAAFLGHRRGGLALAAIGASAGFGAICGSSLATAATMGRIALPELRRQGYPGGLSTAVLAAGGTLGILIPPSVILVIYAMLTEANVGELFLAALVPGLLAAVLYMGAARLSIRGGEGVLPRRSWAERLGALGGLWQVALLFVLVVGGIYGGLFTPTEAAAVGAIVTGIFALVSGRLTWAAVADALRETAAVSAMIYLIVFGAGFYNGFLALARLPQHLAEVVSGAGLAPLVILALILLLYLLLGCVMDSLSMILLTIPVFWPLLLQLDLGLDAGSLAIWFGILTLSVVEIGLITPPVGLNLFIINRLDPTVPLTATWRAMVPFLAADLARVALLFALPVLSLFLIG